MQWTEPSKPLDGVSYYDHVILKTPIGDIIIEWKSWKEMDSYCITLNGDKWIGSEYDLDSAKNKAEDFIKSVSSQLIAFISATTN